MIIVIIKTQGLSCENYRLVSEVERKTGKQRQKDGQKN